MVLENKIYYILGTDKFKEFTVQIDFSFSVFRFLLHKIVELVHG